MRPKVYMDGLQHLIDYINSFSDTKEMEMIEIGSYAGESTELFSKHFKNVIAIDPYIENYDPNDLTCTYAPLSEVRKAYEKRMRGVPNASLLPVTSDMAIQVLIEGKKFDFVYIDGLHTYEQVKKDIENYLPIIKEGGFIGGHDYHPTYQGVINAVNELLGQPHHTTQDTSWIIKL